MMWDALLAAAAMVLIYDFFTSTRPFSRRTKIWLVTIGCIWAVLATFEPVFIAQFGGGS